MESGSRCKYTERDADIMQRKTQKEKQKENQKEKQKENRRLTHTFGPWYDENSRYLFLGSFPSVKSREEGFFYGHPRNRFWKVIAAVFEDERMTRRKP